ncbi:LOS4 [Artemisia annua]|uniref:ATP-dependent RNA helicase n=1 Tax=Artemisia annua TaxID=35608 RepID=A0A2U1LY50_ARTAN|nr:LOS4 [Artemisia annua]
MSTSKRFIIEFASIISRSLLSLSSTPSSHYHRHHRFCIIVYNHHRRHIFFVVIIVTNYYMKELMIHKRTFPVGEGHEVQKDFKTDVFVVTHTNYKYLESYQQLGLSKPLLQALLDDLRLRNPSRLHRILLPLIATEPHRSLCAQARPSADKHTCYVLGILHRIDFLTHDNPQAIVVCPTLELAQEIQATVERVGRYTGVTSQVAVKEAVPDMPVLKSHIVITLPYTLYTLLTFKKLLLSDIKMFVLDAVDHPLQLSVDQWDSAFVMQHVHHDCQILLFYSTLTDKLREHIPTILPELECNRLFVNQEEASIYQSTNFELLCYDDEWKARGIKEILVRVKEMQAVIYVNPGADLGTLRKHLGCIRNLVIAPDLGGAADDLIKFKRGEARVLITCNSMYFGFDVSKVNLVFFYNLPMDSEGGIDFEKYYRVATWGGRYLNKACVFNMVRPNEEVDYMEEIGSHFGRVANRLCTKYDAPCLDPSHYYKLLHKGRIDYEQLPNDELNDDLHEW